MSKGRKYLILDCNYLCHRVKHSTGYLEHNEKPTGVIYGVLKSLSFYQDLFSTGHFIFCWDSKYSKRKDIYPEYKNNRNKDEYTKEEIKFDIGFRKQMKNLYRSYLPLIGFRNNFQQKGYEADDIIASICAYSIRNIDEAIIITADKDLYQCIRPNVTCYNPQNHNTMTRAKFIKEYNIESNFFGVIKSIAGCSTDNVKGIVGVGEIYAIKFLNMQLTKGKKYKDITSSVGVEIINRNKKLIILPMEGTKTFRLKCDNLSNNGWKQVVAKLGMKSIRDRIPFGR